MNERRSQEITKVAVRIRRLQGGRRYHAVPPGAEWTAALCGAGPTDHGTPWDDADGTKLTCSSCRVCVGVQRIGSNTVYTCEEA